MFKADIASRIIEIFSSLPKELVVLIISALPLTERTGTPLAIAKYHMPFWEAFIVSSLGMMLPVIPILLLLDPVSKWLSKKSKTMDKFFNWLFEHTRRRHSKTIDRYGAIGLFVFVAVPLPGTGSWSGSLLAYLFDIDFKYALPSILFGALVAGFLAAIATTSVVAIAKVIGGLALALFILAVLGVYMAGRIVKKKAGNS